MRDSENVSQVKKFQLEIQRQIDKEGLLAISGTNFDKGDSILRVLRAKQYEAKLYGRGFTSKARIAMELNAFMTAISSGNVKPLVFNDSTSIKVDPEAKKILGRDYSDY